MSLHIFSGFVEGDVGVSVRKELGVGLIVPGMDNKTALDIHDNQRLGGELRVTSAPWADCKDLSRRGDDGLTYSELIADAEGDSRSCDCQDKCACNEGCVCIHCCTKIDLEVFSPGDMRQVDVFNYRDHLVYDHFEEVVDLVMPWSMALRLGFVSQ